MIRNLMLNLFLAVALMALFGSFNLGVFLLGLVMGALLLTIYDLEAGKSIYLLDLIKLVRFAGYFLRILIKANVQVAWEIITPGFGMSPAIIRYPVAGLTPAQITMLAICITLTPGTIAAQLNETSGVLYIHGMYMGDRARAVAGIDELRDRILKEVFLV